jgi:SAM-dependent methyltransferase
VHMTTDRAALRQAYDRYAPSYGKARNRKFEAFLTGCLDWFADAVRPVGDLIVDLGSGPGREGELLAARGLVPIAADFAPAMTRACRERGLRAVEMDYYRPALASARFAGAWMWFSLLHAPKADAPGIIAGVVRALVPGGTLLVALFEGDGEGVREADEERYGVSRHFAYYRADELEQLLAGAGLTVTRSERLDITPRPSLAVAARVPGGGTP